jgi:capsular polysaccharide biosynthesis protein
VDTTFDLAAALDVARRRAWVVLASIALAVAAGYGVTQTLSKRYEATATLFVAPNTSKEVDAADVQYAALAQSLVSSYAELAETRAVAEAAARELDIGSAEVFGKVEAKSETGLQVIKIRAEASSPERAAEVANAVSRAVVDRVVRVSGRIANRISVQIVDPAEAPTAAAWPRLDLNLLFGGVVGLLVGLGIALAWERVDKRIRTVADAERELGVPVIGLIPKQGPRQRRRDALIRHADERIAEPYRSAAVTLSTIARRKNQRRILVTSARPGEGKTTVAAHLALALAENHRFVTLIEGDLRRPSLARHFPTYEGPTLEDAFDRATDSTLPTSARVYPNVNILPASMNGGEAGQVLRAPQFEQTLRMALTEADHVLIDGPPALGVSDTIVLACNVDAVILVVRAGASRVDEVQAAHAAFKRIGVDVVGVVLVGAPKRAHHYAARPVNGRVPLPAIQSQFQDAKSLADVTDR